MKSFFSLFILCSLTACHVSTTTVQEYRKSPEGVPSSVSSDSSNLPGSLPKAQQTYGGIDGGGMNGLQMQKLEDFREEFLDYNFCMSKYKPKLSVKKNEASQIEDAEVQLMKDKQKRCLDIAKALNDKLDVLRQKDSTLAGYFYFLLHKRSWYVVPVSMDAIDSKDLGVYFKTEQYGLQNYLEVFFAESYLVSQDPEMVVESILHELVVGVYLLKTGSVYDRCRATKYTELIRQNSTNYGQVDKECIMYVGAQTQRLPNALNLSDFYKKSNRGKSIELTQEDYPLIRSISFALSKRLDTMTSGDLEAMIITHGMRIPFP